MSRIPLWRLGHFIFLGILLTFIFFYFVEYRPYKIDRICAEAAAKQVLNSNSPQAYELYHALYKACFSQKIAFDF